MKSKILFIKVGIIAFGILISFVGISFAVDSSNFENQASFSQKRDANLKKIEQFFADSSVTGYLSTKGLAKDDLARNLSNASDKKIELVASQLDKIQLAQAGEKSSQDERLKEAQIKLTEEQASSAKLERWYYIGGFVFFLLLLTAI